MRSRFLQAAWAATLLLAAGHSIAQVNVQVIPAANGCKGAVIYNNTNHVLAVTLSFIYEGQGGAYYSGQTIPYTINPRSSYTDHWLFNGPVECSKPYNVRTNYTYVDKTVQAEQQQAANQRRLDAERQQREQFQRDQKRQQDAAQARLNQEREEWKRRKEAEMKRKNAIHEQQVRQSSQKPWGQGCPKGMHC
jgi:hypothetical protein